MRGWWGIALVAVLVLGPRAAAEDRREDKTQLTVMTFNAEFLWDGEDPEEGNADFPWKGSIDEAEEHMQLVAAVIQQSDPDVVNLVEVENLSSLTKLNDRFLTGRGYKPYLIKGKDSATGQDVGLLTRVDPEGAAIARTDRVGKSGSTTKTVSKNYVARLKVNDLSIALIGLHFLAFPDHEGRRPERQAQADAIRAEARALRDEGCHLIVLGDWNDYETAPEAMDHRDSASITNVLETVRRMDPADPADDLVNAARFVPKADRYTAHWDANRNAKVDPPKELSSIDHLLLGKHLADRVETVAIPHDHDPLKVSDHFPIVVRLRFGTAPSENAGATVRIAKLVPNPDGDDRLHELVVLKNLSSSAVNLQGWTLKDEGGAVWDLEGSVPANGTLEVRRASKAMSLNNDGDTITLRNAAGAAVHVVTYGPVVEDEEVAPAE